MSVCINHKRPCDFNIEAKLQVKKRLRADQVRSLERESVFDLELEAEWIESSFN